MTLQRSGGAAAFSESAEAYASTMVPALLPVAAEVVRRADLAPGQSVLDIGTGTGTAASLAAAEGRHVTGIDAAAGMLEIARREAPNVTFLEGDFMSLPVADRSIDVILAVHALLFAEDRVAALREWLRVSAPRGRISLSVPGPGAVVPTAILAPIYDRYGIEWGDDYPTAGEVAGWAGSAGWSGVDVQVDPTVAIRLANEAHYRTWLSVGARGRATAEWTPDRRAQFERDLMRATPRDGTGAYRLPFGAIYLSASRA